MQTLRWVNLAIGILFAVCYSYQLFYIPVSWLSERIMTGRKKGVVGLHNYAILICARNEEKVIRDLIDSIHEQTYPQEHLTIFVMADNCTDRTAEVSREAGAIVYTRSNSVLVGKGYALDKLLKHIHEDYPKAFDAYLVFDADNVLDENYMMEMNRCFSEGNELITSYRNSKNYGSNWISAGYALWFLRESRYLNQARFALGASSGISGTGFLFSAAIEEELGGWPFHMLTEDIEFTMNQITAGRKIAFCRTAELYDEQPIRFSQSWHQRMRWARGYWQVLRGYGKSMLWGMFHGNFSCYDMTMNIAPAFILSVIGIFCNLALGIWGATIGDDIMIAVQSLGQTLFNLVGLLFVVGLVTTISEWKHIHTTTVKKLLYVFTFPIYMATYLPIAVASIFHDPSWKPIEHTISMRDAKNSGLLKSRAS